MKLPSKINSYDESIIAKFPIILSVIEKAEISAYKLFTTTKNAVDDIGEFIEVLDCLFALGYIELTDETRLLRYVNRDTL